MSMLWRLRLFDLPMIGAKRHEFPMIGSSFGPGISEYGRVGLSFDDIDESASCLATSVGKILMADENVVRFTSELAAVRTPIFHLVRFKSVYFFFSENWKMHQNWCKFEGIQLRIFSHHPNSITHLIASICLPTLTNRQIYSNDKLAYFLSKCSRRFLIRRKKRKSVENRVYEARAHHQQQHKPDFRIIRWNRILMSRHCATMRLNWLPVFGMSCGVFYLIFFSPLFSHHYRHRNTHARRRILSNTIVLVSVSSAAYVIVSFFGRGYQPHTFYNGKRSFGAHCFG